MKKYCFKNKKDNGFTLAEILITLGIIGVIASIVIPAIKNYVEVTTLRQQTKKSYSMLLQAVNKATADNGGTLLGVINATSSSSGLRTLEPYLKYTKYCSTWSTTHVGGECWKSERPKNYYGLADSTDSGLNGRAMQLADGTFLAVNENNSTNCSDHNNCASTCFDVNGLKGPNRLGWDVHCLVISQTSLKLPNWTLCSYRDVYKDVYSNGNGCIKYILLGDDDYPKQNG